MNGITDIGNGPERDHTVSIVIPAYNEAETIGEVVKDLVNIMAPDAEVIVVDDGSQDGTARAAAESGARVFRHPYNMGNGAAIKTGVRHTDAQVVVLMDADGQHNPKDVPRLLEHISHYHMVVGARNASSHQSLHRRWANMIYNLLATYVTQYRIQDLTSGFRAVRRETLKRFLYLLPNRFSYPTTLTLALLKSGRTVRYVPVKTLSRRGESKIRLMSDGPKFLIIIIKIATLFSPMRIFFPTSLMFFTLGIGYYTYTFAKEHRFTNMSMLLFMTSVIIFMLGLVAEQIAQLRMEKSEDE